MVTLHQRVVDGIDWGVTGVSGALLCISAVGAAFAFRYASADRRPVAREYNYLWRARSFTEVLAALYALSHLLRLQVLWGPASVLRDGGLYPAALCRVYIAATYGVFEPAFLLLALFACHYSVQGRDARAGNPNFNIVLFAAGFSLPSCAAQLVAALFTRIFDLNYGGSRMLRRLFATANTALQEHCPAGTRPGSCAFCVFPLLSTFISAAFMALYLLALMVVTQRIAATVINKALVRRVRVLQLLVTAFVALSLACRGATVLFDPFHLGFEALRVAHMVSVTALVVTIEYMLVLKPVHDSRMADRALKKLETNGFSLPQPLLPPPTELQMLGTQSARTEEDVRV